MAAAAVMMGSSGDFSGLPRCRRWVPKAPAAAPPHGGDAASPPSAAAVGVPPPPPPAAEPRPQRASDKPSYILQHYDATGCAGGAFSWRAAKMDASKDLVQCALPREYRPTTMEHIRFSKADKQRGGGPRVGPFQENIPGVGWKALPKYDFTTKNRSCCFNERMHVEWENHADHILSNKGALPTASVVAKAGFRSCAPCCRDMLALARPTGKTFIMVDLAEDDKRGTFHFVTGDKYLPVPKEACTPDEVRALKRVVAAAQAGEYPTSEAIYEAVMDLDVPVDEIAQSLYLGDKALLPAGCGEKLRGPALLEVLHAEHFARLAAEYGASILRDEQQPGAQKAAILECRARAAAMLLKAWRPHLPAGVDLASYAAAATAPLLPEEPAVYLRLKSRAQRGLLVPAIRPQPAAQSATAEAIAAPSAVAPPARGRFGRRTWEKKAVVEGDDASSAAGSTAAPDENASTLAGEEFQEDVEEF